MNEFFQKWELDPLKLPRHVGIIMDGNGRWATARRLPRVAGHKKGVERVNEITEFAVHCGLQALTLYAFSDENWRRPEEEVSALMSLLRWYLKAERNKILENNIRFRLIGDRGKLSSDILEMATKLEDDSSANTGLNLCIALSYGSRGEILRAVRRVLDKINAGELYPADVDEQSFEDHLDTAGLPGVDMVVRTSGEQRISNFLLWQSAYAEYFFENTPWPDFSESIFASLLKQYSNRERRFGRTPEQVRQSSVSSESKRKNSPTHLKSVKATHR
ncbi:di-trans,poly-cis-decaprenylcistransferase [bacterium]|nr:di-trans,poly-cis-decaprenylcistransferase [bacterium]